MKKKIFIIISSFNFLLFLSGSSLIKNTTSDDYGWFQVTPIDTTLESIHDLFFFNSDTGYVIGWTRYGGGLRRTIGKTLNGGLSWDTTMSKKDVQSDIICFINAQIGIAGAGVLFRTIDSGKTWNKVFVDPVDFDRAAFANDHIGWVVGGFGTIIKTTDAGATWFYQRSEAIDTLGRFLGLSVIDSLNLYVCSQLQLIFSADGGDTWKNVPIPEQYASRFGDTKFIDKDYGWLCGEYRTVIRTTDGGNTWQDASPPVYWDAIRSIDALDKNTAVVVTSAGAILRTENAGETWKEQLPANTYTNMLHRIQIIDDKVAYAVGNDGAILKTTTGGYTSVDDDKGKVTGYSLKQNFPNPFNSQTKITFTIPKSECVSVALYNIQGEVVQQIIDEERSAGEHSLEIYSDNLPSGVYFLRMIAGLFSKSIKVVLLK
ncbi:MAG: T9SS C-terminal target domain-containing protein [Ignavibacteriales bacterium]|nr:MAG: T9SS C-terminal target domain-containing protein [Ignavibacteriales bacterium]